MSKLKICIIGAGNISNTRHIPAIKKNFKEVELWGVIGNRKEKVEKTAKDNKITNMFILNTSENTEEQLKNVEWFKKIDAVMIGTPPKAHYNLARACLKLRKHVLLEKPMTMNTKEAEELEKLSIENKKIINVVHNFQYSNGIKKLEKRFKNNEFGKINTISCIQFTNRERRLPEWYNDLPLGLFYDEAAHFFYLLEKFGGKLKVLNSTAQFNKSKKENTPMILNVNLTAGEIPANISMNFNSPTCEWLFILLCEKKMVIYDFFKDILLVVDNDNLHLAKNILKNSLNYTFQYWSGFIKNGFKLINKNLYYGQDIVLKHFISNIKGLKNLDNGIDVKKGKLVIKAMNEVIEKQI